MMDQSEKFLAVRSYVTFLSDVNLQDRVKLKASQDLLNNFSIITQSKELIDFTVLHLLNILQQREAQFFSESKSYQYRKIIYDIIYRLAVNKKLKGNYDKVFTILTRVLETENEENVLAFLRTVFELLKQQNTGNELKQFLKFVKGVYSELPNKLVKMFEPHPHGIIKDVSESLSSVLAKNIFVITSIPSEVKNSDGTTVSYTFIPKGVASLKVLQELPAYVKMTHQMSKSFADHPIGGELENDIAELIPLIIMATTLQPSMQHRISAGFRKDIFVEFVKVQIRALALLAHLSKDLKSKVVMIGHHQMFARGVLGLFALCPPETTNLRKELLIALRNFIDTELRFLLIPQISHFFNDNYISDGWTTRETLKTLAYSTLADFIYRERDKLKQADLTKAIHLFSLNMNDQSLNTSMQMMSCKILISAAELIRQKASAENSVDPKRELLMGMIQAMMLKCKTISTIEIPMTKNRISQNEEYNLDSADEIVLKMKFQGMCYNVADIKGLLKTLICGVRIITPIMLKMVSEEEHEQSLDILAFTRFVKWSVRAFDIYVIDVPQDLETRQSFVPPKEDKDVLTHYSEIFTMLKQEVFREIFTATIDDIVNQFHNNNAIQIVINYFLTNTKVSSIFATILIEYLLDRMTELKSDLARSNIYLRLFKLVFGCVSLFSTDNEQILYPNLHKVVETSLQLAIEAENPLNYFLLLRALFRSIGGGSHEKLYQKFLPLLPNLLEKLSRLQSGAHKQFMKDLFIELNLCVPVRLSSLLPYISVLMDPLMTALNGSDALIVRGLRTLELCVDNLQSEFLHKHIKPVQAELMQALWRIMRNPSEQIASTAFRLLGKFGGGNREQMMTKPQKLKYTDHNDDFSSIRVDFLETSKSITFPVAKIVVAAANQLKSPDADLFHRRLCWDILYHYLAAAIKSEDRARTISQHFLQTAFTRSPMTEQIPTSFFRNLDILAAEELQKVALTGIFRALTMDDFGPEVKQTIICILRHYILMTVAQQVGPAAVDEEERTRILDPCTILVDAIAEIMADEENDLCRVGNLALFITLQIAIEIFGSVNKASELPLIQHLSEKLSALCYSQAWYVKFGGCKAIKFFIEYMPARWVFTNYLRFFKANMFIIVDMTDEVSYGTVAEAKKNLDQMIILFSPVVVQGIQDVSVGQIRAKMLSDVTQELIQLLKIPQSSLREQSMASLLLLSTILSQTMSEIFNTYPDLLNNMIPQKKQLLKTLTVEEQIGLIESATFCATHALDVFNIGLPRHADFFQEILTIVESEDADLMKQHCYANAAKVRQLRISILKALATCGNIEAKRENIFRVLYNTLTSSDEELQYVGFECSKTFTRSVQLNTEFLHSIMRPLLLSLGDHRNLTMNIVRSLHFLAQLFPNTYNITLCDLLAQHLKKILDCIASDKNVIPRSSDTIKIIVTIIEIFHCIPAATTKFVEVLCALTVSAERSFVMEHSSPFRTPLIKFLLKFPNETLNWFLQDKKIKNHQLSKYFVHFLEHSEGKPLRDLLQNNPSRLGTMMLLRFQSGNNLTELEKHEIRYQAVKILSVIVKLDEHWLLTQVPLVTALKQNWCNEEFQEYHKKIESTNYRHWEEPKLMIKIMLLFVKYNPDNISLLFNLLRACCSRFVCDFQFLYDFLEHEVAKNYPVEWKRNAFFQFVELFAAMNVSEFLKLKIMQLIILPSFSVCFERNEGTSLIEGVPEPNQDNPRNVVSVFFDRIISLENLISYSDAIKIFLLRFLCLLMEKALEHVKKLFSTSETYLRQLLKFARGCTTFKSCVDPITFYFGHLLLSHVAANFLVSRKLIEHVFINLIKGVVPEAKNIIAQALDILIPTLKEKLGDDNKTLLLTTKKAILEDSASMYQLTHALEMIIRHQTHFYQGKQMLMQPLLNSYAKLALNTIFDYKKLSVDLAEVMINWEIRSIKENKDPTLPSPDIGESSSSQPKVFKSYEVYTEVIVNYIIRLVCRLYEADENKRKQPPSAYIAIFQRCLDLVKIIAGSETMSKGLTIKGYTVTCIRDLFYGVNTSQANHENVCCALKLLEVLVDVMIPDQFLAIPSLDQLQNGLSSCILSTHPKVTKSVNDCLAVVTRIFPIESSSSESALSKVKHFDALYKSINGFILKGMLEFESNDSAELNPLVNKMTLMKTICTINPIYVDGYINSTTKVFQKLVKGHPSLTGDQLEMSSELIITTLKILAPGVGKMNEEMHRSFIETLGSMIENFQDAKIVRAILQTLENWLKDDKSNQLLTTKEKCGLLVKMMQNVEKRFPDDQQLNGHFLELILYVYHEESLQSTELMYKLENAFLTGLRCKEPLIRAKFFDLFDSSIPKQIYERLLYVVCSQNWNNIGPYYWIKQCTELLLLTAHHNHSIELANPNMMLASLNLLINISGDLMQISLLNETESEFENNDVRDIKYDLKEFDLSTTQPKKSIFHDSVPFLALSQLQGSFIKKLRTAKTKKFLYLAAQLCYKDTDLAEQVWLDLFPRLWTILDENQQNHLTTVIPPFICSGIHLAQSNCQPSALGTFIEGLTHCQPPIPISPPIVKYVSKTHNLWHMLTLSLEDLALEKNPEDASTSTETSNLDLGVFESLLDMYDSLCEEDMWSGLWQKYAEYEESVRAIALEQQGCLEQARKTYSEAMEKYKIDDNNQSYKIQKEALMWEQQWTNCTKKLCQWDTLIKFASNRQVKDPFLILECAWKTSDWELVKETLKQLEPNCPKEMVWKINLYRGFLAAYFTGPEQNVVLVERYIDVISSYCIREWQKLPEIVSHVHLHLLHASQQVTELREASMIREIAMQNRESALQDITRIFRTWHNRLPAVADNLDRWSDILTWRQHIYHVVFNAGNQQQSQGENLSTLGVNASAQAIITFSNIARKHQLYDLCMESLQDIYSLPTVPVINCLMKIKEQVKCYHDIALSTNDQTVMAKGLEMIELTNVEFFPPEMTAELFALKGMLHSQMENSDGANIWFSAALQLNDGSVGCWALWGEHLEKKFYRFPNELSIAKSAITCFLHSCRHQNDLKSRKYVAKIIWLLNYDDEPRSLLKTIESFITSIGPVHWLPWIPQLLQILISQEDNVIPSLLGQVGRVFPQAIYFEIRTLYLKLKVEQMRKHMDAQEYIESNTDYDLTKSISEQNALKATPAMYTCSKIMHFLRTIHPTILYSLESIVDQNILLRESWHEEVLRLLRQCLQKCYSEAFTTSNETLCETKLTLPTQRFLSKLIRSIENGLDNSSAPENVARTSSTLQQTLNKRLRLEIKDSDLAKRKKQFQKDFEPNPSGGYLLLDVIVKLRQWIKIFENKMKRLPKTLLIDEKYQYLNNLSFKTADIELPGEMLASTPTQYYVKITKFMPEVDIVQRNNISGRRIYIRGHNGKLYPYLIIYDSGFNNTNGEARVLQLFRFINQYFNEQKETSCRMLNLTVPRMVSISPKIRLIQDNTASLTMLDIYSRYCQKTEIEWDDVIQNYYNRLTNVPTTDDEQQSVLENIFRTIQQTLVPKTVLKEWTLKTFPSATDYWTFRKIFTMQLSVINFARYVFDLTKLNPDMMNVHTDTGLINVNFFTFQLNKTTDNSSETNDRPASFRLTPNLVEFVTKTGINGPLTANVIAAARCISQPTFDIYSIMRAIFRDEISMDDVPEVMKRQHVITKVNSSLSLIESRIRLFSDFQANNSTLKELINASMSEDCLSKMDPSWYPWL